MLQEKEATIRQLEETIGTLATSKRETESKGRRSDKTNEDPSSLDRKKRQINQLISQIGSGTSPQVPQKNEVGYIGEKMKST